MLTKTMKRMLSLIAALAVLCALALPASAHGGRHGGRHSSRTPATAYCDTCDRYHDCVNYHGGAHHGGHH